MPIRKLSEQIDELQQSLQTNQELEKEQVQGLELARQRLRFLTQAPEAAGIAELPRLLQTVMTQQTIGVIILGQDGKILLFNSVADRIFGHSLADAGSRGIQSGCKLFLEDKKTEYSQDGSLPWDRSVKGEDFPPQQLFVKRPDLPEGLWTSITCTVLKGPTSNVSGVVVLAVDLTEHVKIGEQLNELCGKLETQISNIETAREEIKALADKLGEKRSAEAAATEMTLSPLLRPPSQQVPTPTQEIAISKLALVVDDIPVNQKLLIMHLKKMGFSVESAFNGKDAVEMVEKKDYSLIFMDCDMPIMNGYEATIAIRQAELKTGKHVPIVAMTSYDRVGDRERCLSVGMDEYLTKGVTQKQLQEVVQWCLSRGTGAQEAPESTTKASGEQDQLLDLDNLIKTFGKFELEEILKLFLMSTTTLTSCLQFAIEDHDLESVSHFAYSLKGPCSSIGLTQMAVLAADITKAGEDGLWDQAMSSYKHLRRLYDGIKKQIEDASREFQWVLS
ncbi:MAG: response regulator [Candidatus Obscuribacterales bacterium]|nr:response regulator [Candidatus Obscuribacterales bacterium]